MNVIFVTFQSFECDLEFFGGSFDGGFDDLKDFWCKNVSTVFCRKNKMSVQQGNTVAFAFVGLFDVHFRRPEILFLCVSKPYFSHDDGAAISALPHKGARDLLFAGFGLLPVCLQQSVGTSSKGL